MLTLSLQSLTDNKIVKATFKHPYSLSLWQESLLIYNYRNFLMAKTIIILFTIVIIIYSFDHNYLNTCVYTVNGMYK